MMMDCFQTSKTETDNIIFHNNRNNDIKDEELITFKQQQQQQLYEEDEEISDQQTYSSNSGDYEDEDEEEENNEEKEEDNEQVEPNIKNGLLESNSLFNIYRFEKNMCDGGGFVLNRLIGTTELDHVDPFLLLDEINTNSPLEYEAGFPLHPHRGIQLVTYMLSGEMSHVDSLGNKQLLKKGDIQYILAAKGITHSEMPIVDNSSSKLWVIHYWLNLPKQLKMIDPDYQHVDSSEVPEIKYTTNNDNNDSESTSFLVKVISGDYKEYKSPLKNVGVIPQILDIDIKLLKSSNDDNFGGGATLDKTQPFEIDLLDGNGSFILVLNGSISINDSNPVEQGKFIVFNSGNEHCKNCRESNEDITTCNINNNDNNNDNHISNDNNTNTNSGKTISIVSSSDCRILFFSSKKIKEPLVKFGPFAMNSTSEIHQCFIDFQYGL